MSQLVRCKGGKLAPAALVCKHLIDRESDRWIQLPQPDGAEAHDYLCPACFEKGPNGLAVDDLRTCCSHCTEEMLRDRGITPIEIDTEEDGE